jgi:hypothetical protein
MRSVAAVSVLALLAVAGCQARRPVELPLPAADSSVVHFVGTPLSGPTSRPAGTSEPSFGPGDLVGVQVRMIALEHMPADVLEPLSARARLITAAVGNLPVLPTAKLTLQARYGQFSLVPADLAVFPPATVGRVRTLAKLRGVLPAGVTASFRLTDKLAVSDPLAPRPLRRNLCVDLYRPADSAVMQVALSVEDVAPGADVQDANARTQRQASRQGRQRPTAHPGLQHETALVDPPEGCCLVLIIPFAFPQSQISAVALVIETTSEVGDEYAPAIKACQDDLANPAAIPPAVVQSFDWTLPAIAAARSGLENPLNRRASLVFLGDQTGAQVLPDLALVADEAVLAGLVARLGDLSTTTDRQALGWRLDLAALEVLRDMQAAARFPRELAAVLLSHTGQAGRNASSMAEILNGLSDREELQRRLVAENTQYLEDSSPAARIRAYDWLSARQKAPPGYDPLAPSRQRRDALEKAQNLSPAGGTP